MAIESFHLNGVKTYAFKSYKELIEYTENKKVILIAINAEKILNNNVGYADGIGAVWALKRHGFKGVNKIPGCELWLEIIKKYHISKSFYLVGSKPDVIHQTVTMLNVEFPGIKILNYRDGYLKSNKEKENLLIDIKDKKPDIIFVAAGSPYQELLMREMHDYYPALYMGLGGSFDVYTGKLKRAPKFWLKIHMEWLYRLVSQPKRIKRQIHLIRFAYLVALGRV
jgi:UDP-N-acetyl-D-mannosaminouronate:lipid I N-acetyl-D-mannosaminouronosyltransferase